MLYSEAIKLILESIGRGDEVEYYLKKFKSSSDFFCILIPDYETLIDFWDGFLFSLEILYKLELYPIIYIGGPECLFFYEKFSKHPFFDILFVNNEICIKNHNKILVIFSYEKFINFYKKNHSILPARVHFIRNRGYIQKNKKNIFQIEPIEKNSINKNILLQYPEEDIGIYFYCSELFLLFPEIHISITSSFLILKELFTVKGAGTLIKRKTTIVHLKKKDITDTLIKELKKQIELCFKKTLKPDALNNISDLITDANFQSFIVLENCTFGYYLSKFAVTIEARGKGIAQDLWDYLISLNIPLFWKTNKKNTIRKWYEKISDGLVHYNNYIVFWKNLSYKDIPKIMDFIIHRGSDFYEDNL